MKVDYRNKSAVFKGKEFKSDGRSKSQHYFLLWFESNIITTKLRLQYVAVPFNGEYFILALEIGTGQETSLTSERLKCKHTLASK